MSVKTNKRPGKETRKRPNGVEDDDSTPAAKRQYTETDQKLAKLYEQLATNNEKVRLNTAKELLQELSPNDELDVELAGKALKRLLRGLCSNREAARAGFFITLTELIRQIYAKDDPFMKLNDLIELAKDTTYLTDNANGQVSA
jgi:DNA polymerase phi